MAQKIPAEVVDYLTSEKTLTLATTGEDGPWAAVLTYVNDDSRLYFWTRPDSNTANHIAEEPTAAFAIGTYTEDWRETKGVQGRGRCTVAQGEDIARLADLFGRKYPRLRPGETSAVIFVGIEPDQLEFIDNTRGAEEGSEFGAEYRRESAFDLPALDEDAEG